MLIGKVMGPVPAARRAQCLQGLTFVAVRTGENELVAADLAGAVPGERVLLAAGTAAARFCMEAPVDAAVVAILDEE